MIAPFEHGLETDLKASMIPDEAFAELKNAYIFRGRVKKRFGSRYTGSGWSNANMAHLYSRLRIQVGTTSNQGVIVGNAGDIPGKIFKVGQMFSIGTVVFTVTTAGVDQLMLRNDGLNPAVPASIAKFSTTNGAYSITCAAFPLTPIYFYPLEPVMGITKYDFGDANQDKAIIFDTQFAYNYTGSSWAKMATAVWTGDNSNMFWSTNGVGENGYNTNIYVSNFHVINQNGLKVDSTDPGNPYPYDDPIWTYDGTTWKTIHPRFFTSATNHTGNFVQTARIIVSFKGFTLLLDTIERDDNNTHNIRYKNRCRYSVFGSPLPDDTAWLQYPDPGYKGAGWTDAPTTEAIISVGFIKDRLIVYFETSTYELAATGNGVLPFIWQKLNTELGSESTFSTVPFDKVLLSIGSTGVHACNGVNVERIDNKIPNEVFKIKDKLSGTARVAGIRDYATEMVYWAFPPASQDSAKIYPNKILVYNYKNLSWAFNDDCITAFGYFDEETDDNWADMDITWEEANFTWDSAVVQAQSRQVIAGNQQGYVFFIDADTNSNASLMDIIQMAYDPVTNLTTVTSLDHTLSVNDYVKIENDSYTLAGSTDGAGNAAGIIDPSTFVEDQIGLEFVIGTQIFYVTTLGTPGVLTVVGAGGTGTFNTKTGAYTFTGCAHTANIIIYPVSRISKVTSTTQHTFTIVFGNPGTYIGGGTIARVSKMSILSKQWNPYLNKDYSFYLAKIDFNVDKTQNGQVTIDYSPSYSSLSMIDEAVDSSSLLGTNILETSPYPLVPLEQVQDQLWHAVYFQTDGDSIQIHITLNENQMLDPIIAESGFELNAMILYTRKTSTRL